MPSPVSVRQAMIHEWERRRRYEPLSAESCIGSMFDKSFFSATTAVTNFKLIAVIVVVLVSRLGGVGLNGPRH